MTVGVGGHFARLLCRPSVILKGMSARFHQTSMQLAGVGGASSMTHSSPSRNHKSGHPLADGPASYLSQSPTPHPFVSDAGAHIGSDPLFSDFLSSKVRQPLAPAS